MAKKLIQNLMQRLHMIPDKEKISQTKSLKFLGDKLHQPHLWHLNRHSVARAFAVGGFAMYTPPLPWQMIIAAALAIYFEANLPIAVALVWITNPLTWIPLYYVAYNLGALLLGREGYSFSDFQSVFSSLGDAWDKLGAPFLLGCFGMMIICALIGFFGIQIFWRYHVLSAWEKRKTRRREAVKNVFETLPETADTSVVASLEDAWKNVEKPFLAERFEMTALIAAAGREAISSFKSHAASSWEHYETERQAADAKLAKRPLLLKLRKTFRSNGIKLLQITAGAGRAGIQAFWNTLADARAQRKIQRRKNSDAIPANPETNHPQK
ncbi:MAG: DUF2062 domain-containing protein [Gammaproteobacteria bacterium]